MGHRLRSCMLVHLNFLRRSSDIYEVGHNKVLGLGGLYVFFHPWWGPLVSKPRQTLVVSLGWEAFWYTLLETRPNWFANDISGLKGLPAGGFGGWLRIGINGPELWPCPSSMGCATTAPSWVSQSNYPSNIGTWHQLAQLLIDHTVSFYMLWRLSLAPSYFSPNYRSFFYTRKSSSSIEGAPLSSWFSWCSGQTFSFTSPWHWRASSLVHPSRSFGIQLFRGNVPMQLRSSWHLPSSTSFLMQLPWSSQSTRYGSCTCLPEEKLGYRGYSWRAYCRH